MTRASTKKIPFRGWKKLVLLLVPLLALAPSVASRAAPVSSDLQRECSRMWGRLVNQQDPRILRFRDPDGGLCGPTCVLNGMIADYHRRGGSEPNPERILSLLATAHREIKAGQGVGSGVSWIDMDKTAQVALHRFGYPKASAVKLDFTNGNGFSRLANPGLPHSYSLLAVYAYDPHTGATIGGHWIKVTALDEQNKLIRYIDPNFEKEERTLHYTGGPGTITIQDPRLNYLGRNTSAAPVLHSTQAILIDLGDEPAIVEDHAALAAMAAHFSRELSAGVPASEKKIKITLKGNVRDIDEMFEGGLESRMAAAGLQPSNGWIGNVLEGTIRTPEERKAAQDIVSRFGLAFKEVKVEEGPAATKMPLSPLKASSAAHVGAGNDFVGAAGTTKSFEESLRGGFEAEIRRRGEREPDPDKFRALLDEVYRNGRGNGLPLNKDNSNEIAEVAARRLGYLQSSTNRVTLKTGEDAARLLDPKRPHAVALLQIDAEDPHSREIVGTHYVRVTAVDRHNRIIDYIDPRFPGEPRRLTYHDHDGNGLTLDSDQLHYVGQGQPNPVLQARRGFSVDLGEAPASVKDPAATAKLLADLRGKLPGNAPSAPKTVEIYLKNFLIAVTDANGPNFERYLASLGIVSKEGPLSNQLIATVEGPRGQREVEEFVNAYGSQIKGILVKTRQIPSQNIEYPR